MAGLRGFYLRGLHAVFCGLFGDFYGAVLVGRLRTVDETVDRELDEVEDVRGSPDQELVEHHLPPSQDSEDVVQPPVSKEEDRIVSVKESKFEIVA